MAQGMKSLAKDTAIYGVSSIVGKFLNWLLVPFYTRVLASQSEYGTVTELFAWTAMLLVILTYGMETGFFRFANKYREDANKIYGNSLISVGFTSLIFSALVLIFHQPIADFLDYSNHSEFIWLLGLIVATDAFASIPFAYLRFSNRPLVFAGLKLLYVALNIGFNLFFFLLCPYIYDKNPALISSFYNPNYGVGYVFVSNFIATMLQTLVLLPYLFKAKFEFDKTLLKRLLRYSYPLLFLGVAGIANQTLDRMIFKFLLVGEKGKTDLGIYGGIAKIAMIIMMFTQAFRYAYEPFIFAQTKDRNSKKSYALATKYYVIFALMIYLGMVLFIDILKYLIDESYWIGLKIVPIMLFSYIFQGLFFNLSIWYKLTDRNHYGAWFSFVGTIIILVGNVLFVPTYSYWASVWSIFVGFLVITLLSYAFGQKYFPIKYDLKSMLFYTVLMLILYGCSFFIQTPYIILNYILKIILMIIYISVVIKKDFPLNQVPVLNRFF